MTLAPVLTGCHVCRGPMADTIATWMKAGVKDTEIERRLEQSGNRISRITLGKHRRKHLTSPFERQRIEAARSMQMQQRKIKGPTNVDLAELVRDTVTQNLQSGILEPTINEGLRAVQILDERAAKGADRDFLLLFARAISGSLVPVIEAEFREIDAEASEDDADMTRLLTAGA